jgi:hypothetical protein
MNQARITRAELTPQRFELESEGAGAYDSSLGLTRYLRRLTMKTAGELEVNDVVESSSAHTFTEVLHSDTKMKAIGGQRYETAANGVALHIHLRAPSGAASTVEQNVVMGPGKPGSVDKGFLEPRGERLMVSTAGKVTSTQFEWELRF